MTAANRDVIDAVTAARAARDRWGSGTKASDPSMTSGCRLWTKSLIRKLVRSRRRGAAVTEIQVVVTGAQFLVPPAARL